MKESDANYKISNNHDGSWNISYKKYDPWADMFDWVLLPIAVSDRSQALRIIDELKEKKSKYQQWLDNDKVVEYY